MRLYPLFAADMPALNPATDKQTVREQARALREQLAVAAGDRAGEALVAHFLDQVPWRVCEETPMPVGGYWPIRDEIDPRPLLAALAEAGCQNALPAVVAPQAPLCFRTWLPGDALLPGPYGIPTPAETAPVVRPALLLVPLLAFDRSGHRLGYGGGYYDRTIASLRAEGELLAVGLAYAGQQLGGVPKAAADEALDWVVTERGAIRSDLV